MIRLFGLVPYRDIDIVEVGLRPGEKLYEELLIRTEDMERTDNDMIFVERDTPLTRQEVDRKLALLRSALEKEESEIGTDAVREVMKQVVPSFRDPEEVNGQVDDGALAMAAQ